MCFVPCESTIDLTKEKEQEKEPYDENISLECKNVFDLSDLEPLLYG